MTNDQALQVIANHIWDAGEALFSLCPTAYAWGGKVTDYHTASDKLVREYGATHYSLKWNKKGTSVKVTFYRAEAYGAADVDESNPLRTNIVKIR